MSEEEKEKNTQSLTWFIIKMQNRAIIILAVLWFFTIGLFVWKDSQYDYVGETTIEQQTDQGGDVSSVISKEGVSIGVPGN